MVRGKVKLEYISDPAARKRRFKKRVPGLVKKVTELRTLCDIDVCSVVFNPDDQTQPPDVQPSIAGAKEVFKRFQQQTEFQKGKRMVSQADFTRQRIAKATEKLRKIQAQNWEKELTGIIDQFLMTGAGIEGLNLQDLTNMGRIIDQDLQKLYGQMGAMNFKENPDQTQQFPGPLTAPPSGMWTEYGGPSYQTNFAPLQALPPPPPPPVQFGGPNMEYGGSSNQSSFAPPPPPPVWFGGSSMEYGGPSNQSNFAPPPPQPVWFSGPNMEYGGSSNQSNFAPPPALLALPPPPPSTRFGGPSTQYSAPPPALPRPPLPTRFGGPNMEYGGSSTQYSAPPLQDLPPPPPPPVAPVPDDIVNWTSSFFPDEP